MTDENISDTIVPADEIADSIGATAVDHAAWHDYIRSLYADSGRLHEYDPTWMYREWRCLLDEARDRLFDAQQHAADMSLED